MDEIREGVEEQVLEEGEALENEVVGLEDNTDAQEEIVDEQGEEGQEVQEEQAKPQDQWSGDYSKLKNSYENLRIYANRLKQEQDLRFAQMEGRLSQIGQKDESLPPDARFDEAVKKNPYEAVRSVAEETAKQTAERLARIEAQQTMLAIERTEQNLRTQHPDYDDVKPIMSELWNSGQFAHLVNPNNPNDPAYMEFLYYKARESKKGDIASAAKAQGRQEVLKAQQSKRKAFVESSGKTTATKDFKELSLEEMEKTLGIARDRTSSV